MTTFPTRKPLGSTDRIQAWHDARFGLMVHWGLYSVPAGEWKGQKTGYVGEWIMSRFHIPIAEYEALAADFRPDAFDADTWCRLAKEAGMGYLVFTAKHHDGFAMFHSAYDPYNIVDATPFGRDPVAELAAACARHGLMFGLYYSQSLDWHEEDAGGTEPGNGTNHEGMAWGNDWDFPDHARKDFSRYFERKVVPQIRELLTGYGPISHLWFDCPFTITPRQSEELYALAKALQPDILINSRLGNGLGDFQSLGDNLIPGMPFAPGWEAVGTLNNTWGYKRDDSQWKTSGEIIELLGGLAGKGINYLLNVGPDETGRIPEPSARVLSEVGKWMDDQGKSIHAVERSPYPADLPSGPVTRRGNTLYFHLHHPPRNNRLDLAGLSNPIERAWFLHAPEAVLKLSGRCVVLPGEAPPTPPPVVAVRVVGTPRVADGIVPQADGDIVLPVSLATIHSEKEAGSNDSATPASTHFEPDGALVSRDRGIRISPLGSTSNWWKLGDRISWDFDKVSPGAYRVRITSTGLYHGQPWQGGHRVGVRVDGAEISATLEMSEAIENAATRCYAQAVSDCGTIMLKQSSAHRLFLEAVDIQPGDAGLAVLAVRLTPVPSLL